MMGLDPFLLSLCWRWSMAFLGCLLPRCWKCSGSKGRVFHCKRKSRMECCRCPNCWPQRVGTSVAVRTTVYVKKRVCVCVCVRALNACMFVFTRRACSRACVCASVRQYVYMCLCSASHCSADGFCRPHCVGDQRWYGARNPLAHSSCSQSAFKQILKCNMELTQTCTHTDTCCVV